MTPEEKLWQAVILQALTDALATADSLTILSKAEKKEAINFFEARGDWYRAFYQTCCLAGYDPDYIKEGYEYAKKRGISNPESISVLVKGKSPKRKGRKFAERTQPTHNRHGDGYRGARY